MRSVTGSSSSYLIVDVQACASLWLIMWAGSDGGARSALDYTVQATNMINLSCVATAGPDGQSLPLFAGQ